jgi:hypothetical protein
MRRLRRTLSTFREIDLARGGAGGAKRLLAAIDGDVAMTAQARAVAVALVNLARSRGRAPRMVSANEETSSLQVDPALLDALGEAHGHQADENADA